MADNIKVLIRVRPLIDRESNDNHCIQLNEKQIKIKENTGNALFDDYASEYVFNFDKIADQKTNQQQIFQTTEVLLDSFLEGYNSTIMCYGVTSSGKSYTMFNHQADEYECVGLVPRIIEYIYNKLEAKKHSDQQDYELSFSYIQIYNENISDLLNINNNNEIKLKIITQQDQTMNQVQLVNASQYLIKDPNQLIQLLINGDNQRKTSQTKYNELSSRSHVVLTFYLKTAQFSAKLNLIDLAGSERLSANIQSQIGQETKFINKSLQTLNKVVNQLSTGEKFISYRDSTLTRLLIDSLGGNYKTLIVVNVSPAQTHFYETLNTLRFAERAKKVINKAFINENYDLENAEDLVPQLKQQLEHLKQIYEKIQSSEKSDIKGATKNQEYTNALEQKIQQLQEILSFGGLIQFDDQNCDVSEQLQILNQQLNKKLNLQTSSNKLFQQLQQNNQNQEKFQLVLNKQLENIQYLIVQINKYNNYYNQILLEHQLECQQKSKQSQILKQLMLNEQMGQLKLQQIAKQANLQLKLNTNENDYDTEQEQIIQLESELNQLEFDNQLIKNKINKANQYIKELKETDGDILRQKLLKQLSLNQISTNSNQNSIIQQQASLQQYYKEQNATINILKQKMLGLIETKNINTLEKLVKQVIDALKSSTDELQ